MQLFTSQSWFRCTSIVDERSAGYVALGMARQLQEPVVVLTTSGTAVLNLAPAMAEAYHQQIPLIVITADRPPEKISRFNNQWIDQEAPFFTYSKGFYQLPLPVTEPEVLTQVIRMTESLLHSAISLPAGPVHMNIPLEEPLYEPLPPVLQGNDHRTHQPEEPGTVSAFGEVGANTKIMILAGMGQHGTALSKKLLKLLKECQSVVIAENIANLPCDQFISQPELLLAGVEEDGAGGLIPDLLISFGGQVVSKRLKLFLQKLPDLVHVEIDGHAEASLAKLGESVSRSGHTSPVNRYLEAWKLEQERAREIVRKKLQTLGYGNLWVIQAILAAAPSGSVIHLGNSSTIRYSQVLPHRKDLTYYSNRGTSGIDGSVSAAVGAAMVSDTTHILLVGDLSFVYDSNAMWNMNFPENLKIVVLNDDGGGIFRLLKGPSEMEFFEEFLVTHHPVSPELLAKSFGRQATHVGNREELKGAIDLLFSPGSTLSVLDVDTSKQENSRIFKEFINLNR
jgi:2-succinyl-5-enolpyruvyl-6-hydroxy-3-cyclohexene-1-carboxylate synthase